MSFLTVADALRLAINILRDSAESHRMPSGIKLAEAAATIHADVAKTLETSLRDLHDTE